MSEINDLIESYNSYIKMIPPGCQKIADKLREDKIVEALQDIVDFTEGVNWLSQARALLQQNSVSVELQTERINEFLNEINDGLEIQDYIVVADMFEYEVQPFFEENLKDIKLN